jgi:hypothetical protein
VAQAGVPLLGSWSCGNARLMKPVRPAHVCVCGGGRGNVSKSPATREDRGLSTPPSNEEIAMAIDPIIFFVRAGLEAPTERTR